MQFLSNKFITESFISNVASDCKLDRYLSWNHDCTFELSFTKRLLAIVEYDLDWVLPYEVIVEGRSLAASNPAAIFEIAASCAKDLSRFGDFNVFSFGSYFERKDIQQIKNYASSAQVHCSKGKAKIDFTYRGEENQPIAEIANEARDIVAESPSVDDASIKANWWAVRAELKDLSNTPQLLFSLIERLGSGQVFEHRWSASIMGVDEENVTKHGFELYNQVAQSGLTADEIKVLFKLQFLDMRGLDVVRQLCEGETNYTIPLGTFRHQKKKATLGVYTNKDGHRLSLTLKDAPTGEEWAHLESTLGTTFDRKLFPGKL